ncbi:hypothetical protein [Lentzea sp.]|uniref:hypothetical protein n=1 Tax=Lentzea sp. TaxID=56099 RepID=UPI002B8AAC59|nr:hypothetical protein [Lentzea sp.]HUQ61417.1 hypothetical protein [Lentzea sp.]
MAPNPAEVSLTSPRSAVAQRVIAGLSAAAVVAAMVVLALSGQPWWAILLWDLGLLVVVFIMLAIWFTAGESAKQTTALLAVGKQVLGEVVGRTEDDDGEDVHYELALWVPLPDGGFQATHRCRRAECSRRQPGDRLTVLVDPKVRTWAVPH